MAADAIARRRFLSNLQDHATRPQDGTYNDVERAARLIMRHAAIYARIQEIWCNVELSDAHTALYEAKEARLEQRITARAQSIGCAVIFSGDPRGATVKLVMPDGYTDDWGREGVCVPTA